MNNYKFIIDSQIDKLTNSLFLKNIQIYGFTNFSYDSDILKINVNKNCFGFWVKKTPIHSNSSSKYQINISDNTTILNDDVQDNNINICWKISFESYDELSNFYVVLINEVHKLFQTLNKSNSNHYTIQPGTKVHVKANMTQDWNERIFLCKYLNKYYCLTNGLADKPDSNRAVGWEYCLEDPGYDNYEYSTDSDDQCPCTITHTWRIKDKNNTETDEE